MKANVYERVTAQIVAELEKGIRPWIKPWNVEHTSGRIIRPKRVNGVAYRGINVLMLWAAAAERGYSAPIWMTFKQASEQGGKDAPLSCTAGRILCRPIHGGLHHEYVRI